MFRRHSASSSSSNRSKPRRRSAQTNYYMALEPRHLLAGVTAATVSFDASASVLTFDAPIGHEDVVGVSSDTGSLEIRVGNGGSIELAQDAIGNNDFVLSTTASVNDTVTIDLGESIIDIDQFVVNLFDQNDQFSVVDGLMGLAGIRELTVNGGTGDDDLSVDADVIFLSESMNGTLPPSTQPASIQGPAFSANSSNQPANSGSVAGSGSGPITAAATASGLLADDLNLTTIGNNGMLFSGGIFSVDTATVFSTFDIVSELVAVGGEDIDASDITFTSATLERTQAATLDEIGFSYIPGSGDDGVLQFLTDETTVFDSLDASLDDILVEVAFTVSNGTLSDTGTLTYVVGRVSLTEDIDISLNLVGNDVNTEVVAQAVAEADQGIEVISASGDVGLEDFFTDDVLLDDEALLNFYESNDVNLAIAAVGENSMATATAQGRSFALAIALEDATATASSMNISTANSIAINDSTANAEANDTSEAVAVATDNAAASATSTTSSEATAEALNGSASDADASDGSVATSVATEGSVTTSDATDNSTASATSMNISSATAVSSEASTAAADADSESIATASAIEGSTSSVVATGGSDALAFAEENSVSSASANNASSASVTSSEESMAVADADSNSTAFATAADRSDSRAEATGSSIALTDAINSSTGVAEVQGAVAFVGQEITNLASVLADNSLAPSSTILITGFPEGSTFSEGTLSSDGTELTIVSAPSQDFAITLPDDFTGSFNLEFRTEDGDEESSAVAEASQAFTVVNTVITLNGGDGEDDLYGSIGDDILRGGNGNDIIHGGAGNDIINGNAGSDTLSGDAGDDLILGQGGTDIIDGGSGIDTNSFQEIGVGVTATVLGDGSGTADYGSVNETFTGIENLTGSESDDVLTGIGSDGHTLRGLGGDDILNGGEGDDLLVGNEGDDILRSNGGADRLFGNEGLDRLNAGAGNDLLVGGDGNDFLLGGEGTDNIDGGSGIDTNSFQGIGVGVTATVLGDGSGTADYGSVNETFIGIEYLTGSENDDVLTGLGSDGHILRGLEGDDLLSGGLGDDILIGNQGADVLRGGRGNDLLSGNEGPDRLNAGGGNDRLIGGVGNDLLLGGAGTDAINGGAGFDINRFTGISVGVTASIFENGSGTAEYGGVSENFAGIDALFGSENNDTFRVFGSGNVTLFGDEGDDTLIGGSGNDRLNGGNGNDTLSGLAGDDLLVADEGDDELLGGSGDDRLLGGLGDDILTGGLGFDTLFGNEGDDTLTDAD